ncbi:MAG: Gfo/Idh/MocA family oxidoreductase [Armatimonadota bacterium]|nr:Gfo/Idh/MocA family oxidoreductase [Armatimonadota bacterium]MDW8143935.1 Gfo/Idh/MocA family oxidoreductase [Armatimonadota bacterium]
MKPLRIAIVGAGSGRGQSWMATLNKLSKAGFYDFCALCEIVPEKAKESAKRWGVKAYTNLLELLDNEPLDVLLNGTPPDANVMVVGMAAKRKVHVLTEIPIAPTLSLARFMMDMVRESGTKLEVCEQVWLWAKEQLKRKIIDAGLIGEVTHARLHYTNKADYHGINAVRMLVRSPVKRVLGYTQVVKIPPFKERHPMMGDIRHEDRWDFALMEFENGVVCLFESPLRARLSPRWEIEGSLGQIIGDNLYIGSQQEFKHFPFVEEYTTIQGERILEHIRVDTDPPIVFENPYKAYLASNGDEVARMELLLGMRKAITEGVEPVYGAENAYHDIEVLFAMRESARRWNVWVELPLTEETELEKQIEAEFRKVYGHDPREFEALVNTQFLIGGVRYIVANWD